MVVPDEKFLILAALLVLLAFVLWLGETAVRRRKRKAIEECIGPELQQYDDLPSGVAVLMAWSDPGDNPRWHQAMQEEVRSHMPVLARALDRMVQE